MREDANSFLSLQELGFPQNPHSNSQRSYQQFPLACIPILIWLSKHPVIQFSTTSQKLPRHWCGAPVWTLESNIHTAIFQMDNQQEPTVEHMELCPLSWGSLDGRGVGREWIHVYGWLVSSTVHLKISKHWQLALSQYKIKSLKKKKKKNTGVQVSGLEF